MLEYIETLLHFFCEEGTGEFKGSAQQLIIHVIKGCYERFIEAWLKSY